MIQMASGVLSQFPLYVATAVVTHLVVSFGQTLMHYKFAHHAIGGKLFHNHINFHHTHYSHDHLVSQRYLGDEGNITPFFFIPVLAVAAISYFVVPIDLLVVEISAGAASFYAHVFFDKQYHVDGSILQRFGWFRHKQELHFVHHRHANRNFAVIHFFWDKLFRTYRAPDHRLSKPADHAGLTWLRLKIPSVSSTRGHGPAAPLQRRERASPISITTGLRGVLQTCRRGPPGEL